MTFDDDFIVVEFDTGIKRRVTCKSAGIEWPPPERFDFQGGTLERVSFSKITDEDRAEMTHVCRGALYKLVSMANPSLAGRDG